MLTRRFSRACYAPRVKRQECDGAAAETGARLRKRDLVIAPGFSATAATTTAVGNHCHPGGIRSPFTTARSIDRDRDDVMHRYYVIDISRAATICEYLPSRELYTHNYRTRHNELARFILFRLIISISFNHFRILAERVSLQGL